MAFTSRYWVPSSEVEATQHVSQLPSGGFVVRDGTGFGHHTLTVNDHGTVKHLDITRGAYGCHCVEAETGTSGLTAATPTLDALIKVLSQSNTPLLGADSQPLLLQTKSNQAVHTPLSSVYPTVPLLDHTAIDALDDTLMAMMTHGDDSGSDYDQSTLEHDDAEDVGAMEVTEDVVDVMHVGGVVDEPPRVQIPFGRRRSLGASGSVSLFDSGALPTLPGAAMSREQISTSHAVASGLATLPRRKRGTTPDVSELPDLASALGLTQSVHAVKAPQAPRPDNSWNGKALKSSVAGSGEMQQFLCDALVASPHHFYFKTNESCAISIGDFTIKVPSLCQIFPISYHISGYMR